MTRSAFKQQQLGTQENRRIQGSHGLEEPAPDSLTRPALLGRRFKQQHLVTQENRRIQESRGLDVAAWRKQQKEGKQLLREEMGRIEERRGFDFGDIPPLDIRTNRLEPCWDEKSTCPAPKLYVELGKFGLKSYNCQYDTSYQLTKILRVYFSEMDDEISLYHMSIQAEDKLVASPQNFKLVGVFGPGMATVSTCRKEKDGWNRACHVLDYYIGVPRRYTKARCLSFLIGVCYWWKSSYCYFEFSCGEKVCQPPSFSFWLQPCIFIIMFLWIFLLLSWITLICCLMISADVIGRLTLPGPGPD